MKLLPSISVFTRHAVYWLAWLTGAVAMIFAVLAATMYFWVLPNIADQRETVANMMSRALGQRVTLDAVSGVWQQARPEFRLQGVRLLDPQNRPALYLPELKASFSWRSLLILEPRFSQIELQGLVLGVRRARDGHFYVGGIPVNPAAPNSDFANWLLRQGRVHVSEATVNWLDEVREAPPLILRGVEFTLTNARRNHRLQLFAIPPASLAQPLTVNAQFSASDVDDIKTWKGTIETVVAGVALAPLAPWLALPYQPRQGFGGLHMKFDVAHAALTGVRAEFNLRSIEITLGADLPALRLAHMRGLALWKQGAEGQRVAFENLRIAQPGTALGTPFNLALAWNAASHEITAKALSLGGWQSVLPSLPMDAALRTRLQTLQPQGRVDTLRFRWSGAEPGLDNFSIATQFTGLGVTAVDRQPGLENFSGRLEGDARAGVFKIDSKRLAIHLPKLFREPLLTLDDLRARGSWKKTARGRLLTLDEAVFSNRDVAGTARGSYELIADHPGVIDLNAHLTRVDGTAVYRYLPNKIGDLTVNWVKKAIVTGYSDDVRLSLRGDLAQFPFGDGNGVFRLDARVLDAAIDYVPGWPRIEGIQARMLFLGKAMEVTTDRARIYGVALSPVKAVIPDLIHHEEQLHIEGEANGPIQDFIRFANFSPVGERLRGFTDTLDANGPMRLALKLHVPLRHNHDTTLSGRLSFLGDTVFPSGLPRLDQVRGDIDFTGDSLTTKNLTAQFLGGPLRIDTITRPGQVQILAQGRATAVGLTPWLGKSWGSRLSGDARWRGQIVLERETTRMRIESDLVGMESRLPAPLNKLAAQPLPLVVTRLPQPGNEQLIEMQLDRTLGAIWQTTADNRISRGELRFGGPAKLPQEAGWRLSGSGRGLALTEWVDLMPGASDAADLQISSIDLNFSTLDLMGRHFPDVRVQGRNRNGLLRLGVNGRDMNGTLTYRPAERAAQGSTARISAQFKQLSIPAALKSTAQATATQSASDNMKASEMPALDLLVEDFRLDNRPLGRLDATAHGAPQGMVIDSLQLTHPDSVVHMSGLWRDSGLGETQAKLQVEIFDAGRMLSRFGFKDAIKRGIVDLNGEVSWTGAPVDFDFQTLAGTLSLKARSGQFLKVEPGVAKLLGVLSLQSLPRRLSFDFRDIFNDGFAFDEISATMLIARGVVYSDDLRMKGPAAKVAMTGLAKLTDETVQLRVKVTPKLSEGVAVAGALLGGPIAGLGVLAAQKLLRDPFEEANSREYMVTGPWREPEVTRLTKTRKETSKDSDG